MSQNENFTITQYSVDRETSYTNSRELSEGVIRIALSDSAWEKIRIFEALEKMYNLETVDECHSFLANQELMQLLRDDKFDFAIVDPWTASGFFLLPQILKVPFAVYTVPTSWHSAIARIPRLPSFTPFFSTDHTDEMTFQQRLFTFVLAALAQVKFALTYHTETLFAQKYLDPNMKTSYNELLSKASLWFIEEDLSLNYPSPHMPNSLSIVNIGDKARPVKPLSQDVEMFLQSSPDPAILVSFGTLFDYVPEFLAREFCDAFRQIRYQVLWKLKNESHCSNVKNVKIMDWIPQNDLLAHDKVRLFITHGGFNSMTETVYHAKPVIVFPMFADQPNTAAFVVSRKVGHSNVFVRVHCQKPNRQY